MKTLIVLFIGIIALSVITATSCTRIDAGHTGIKVNLYGNNKGVSNVTEVTGIVWFWPFTHSVYEVATFVQNALYTKNDESGSPKDEQFKVTTKDGMVVSFDVSMNYYTPQENVVFIFKKYRKPVKELTKTVVRNYLRKGFNNAASFFTAEMMYEQRAKYEFMSDSIIRSLLEPEGFVVEQIVIINELRLPKAVVHNINEKVNASQIAMKKQQEVAQARADADKKIEIARGNAESMKIKADAERYAYEQKQISLTQLLIQQQYIEKWDGSYGSGNVFGDTPTLMKNIK